jgi:hypothetical protein
MCEAMVHKRVALFNGVTREATNSTLGICGGIACILINITYHMFKCAIHGDHFNGHGAHINGDRGSIQMDGVKFVKRRTDLKYAIRGGGYKAVLCGCLKHSSMHHCIKVALLISRWHSRGTVCPGPLWGATCLYLRCLTYFQMGCKQVSFKDNCLCDVYCRPKQDSDWK